MKYVKILSALIIMASCLIIVNVSKNKENKLGFYTQLDSPSLGALTDVNLTSPSNGDVLTYDGTEWINNVSGSSGLQSTAFQATSPITVSTTTTSVTYGLSSTADINTTGNISFNTGTSTGILNINQICNSVGECWDTPATQGSQVEFYPHNTDSDVATYEDMFTYPDGITPIDESCSADSDIAGGYCTIDTYISSTSDIAILEYPAGTTRIRAYTYVSSANGVSNIVITGYKRATSGVETYLGQATTTEINQTSIAESMASFTSGTDFAFSADGTDRLVMKVQGWTDSNVTRVIHWTYQDTGFYSHIETPITNAEIGHARVYADETITGTWDFTATSTHKALKLTTFDASNPLVYADSDINTGIGFNGPDIMGFYSGGTERLLINAMGHVGVGTTTPIYKLDVYGNAMFGSTTAGTLFVNSGSGRVGIGTTSPTFALSVVGDERISTNLVVKGNVGVGIESASQKLEIVNNSYLGFRNAADTGTAGYMRANTSNGIEFLTGAYATPLAMNFSDISMQSLSTGKVGIGTTTPEAKLDLWGVSGGKILTLFSNTGTKFLELLNTGVATLLGTWNFSGATVKQHVYPSFTWPGTATTTTATTTLPYANAFVSELFSTALCRTTSGTTTFELSDGTNKTNMITATTTASSYSFTTNNTFTAGERRDINIGALTNAQLTCTFDKIVNN